MQEKEARNLQNRRGRASSYTIASSWSCSTTETAGAAEEAVLMVVIPGNTDLGRSAVGEQHGHPCMMCSTAPPHGVVHDWPLEIIHRKVKKERVRRNITGFQETVTKLFWRTTRKVNNDVGSFLFLYGPAKSHKKLIPTGHVLVRGPLLVNFQNLFIWKWGTISRTHGSV